MNKKGFTLIEIIVCLILISLISTISIVAINKNKQNKNDKLINTIVSSADVYYSMNNDIKEKLNNNYGYLVVSIEELKNNGLLDKNFTVPQLTDKERKENKSYEKLVIVNKTLQNNKYQLLSNDEDLGYVDYIYPYEDNIPFIVNLNDVSIENFEKEDFKCNSLLKDINNNDTDELFYLDSNYELKSINQYDCNLNVNNLKSGENNKIVYTINSINISGNRNVFLYKNPQLKLLLKYDDNKTYNSGTWTNKNVLLEIVDENQSYSDNYSNRGFKYYVDNEELSNNSKTITESKNGSVYYSLKNKITGSESGKNYISNFDIKIDKVLPEVNFDYNKNLVIFNDDGGSGLYKYGISNNEDCKTDTIISATNTVVAKENKYYCVSDNAGNIFTKKFESINNLIPNITIIPVSNSLSQFKMVINDNNGIKDVNIQVSFEDSIWSDAPNIGDNEYLGKLHDLYKTKFTNQSIIFTGENKNTINSKIEKDENNKKEYLIDMKDFIESCYRCKHCVGEINTVENANTCAYWIKPEKLFNISLNYKIIVTNNKNNAVEYSFKSQINTQLDKDSFKNPVSGSYTYAFMGNDKYHTYISGLNTKGDMLFYTNHYYEDKYDIYYYNNESNKTEYLNQVSMKNESEYRGNLEGDIFEDYFYYYNYQRESYKYYENTVVYDLTPKIICVSSDNYKKNTTKFVPSHPNSIYCEKRNYDISTSNTNKYSDSMTYNNKKDFIDNSGLIEFYSNYLTEWDNMGNNTNPSKYFILKLTESHYIKIPYMGVLFKNNNYKNNGMYYSINVMKYDNKESDVFKLFFKPGVTISNKSNNYTIN